MSVAKDISTTLSERLKNISIAGGFSTDIGASVYRGKVSLDESNVPCIVIEEGDDSVSGQQGRSTSIKVDQQYNIEGYAACDPDNPNDAAHDAIADIKKCLFGSDVTYGGKVYRFNYVKKAISKRKDGTALICGVVTVTATYPEDLAAP